MLAGSRSDRAPIPVGIELSQDTAGRLVLRVECDGPPSGFERAGAIGPPPARKGQPVPAIAIETVCLDHQPEQGVSARDPLQTKPGVGQAGLGVQVVFTHPIRPREAFGGDRDGIGAIGAPPQTYQFSGFRRAGLSRAEQQEEV